MSLDESTKNLLTDIAENIPKVKQQGYDEGRTKEWSDFWDVFQDYGNRTAYQVAFYRNWNNETFKPKYDIKPTECSQMFQYSKISGDFREILKECNVVLDTSKSAYMQNAFDNCQLITHLPEISFESATLYDTRVNGTFVACYALQHIDKVILPTEKHQPMNNTFQSCKNLTHLRIGGVIGNNFNVSWSPLDLDSVKDIILHLKDYSTENTGAYTLTLKDECKARLAPDTDAVEFKGQYYTYLGLITAKGWNLA